MRFLFALSIALSSLALGVLTGYVMLLLGDIYGSATSAANIGHPDRSFDAESTDYSFTSVSVLCWVLTSPDNLLLRAIHITQTWGPRCNLTLYVTEREPDHAFPGTVVVLPVDPGRDSLWGKTRAALVYIFYNYHDRYEWFVKADDDTFLIVDNLRYFLASKDTQEPVFYGCHLRFPDPENRRDLLSGGAGYVMGRETLRRFMGVVHDPSQCPLGGPHMDLAEDASLTQCLKNARVRIGNATDALGRKRFLASLPMPYLGLRGIKAYAPWMPLFDPQGLVTGMRCCSDYLISMHYVSPDRMYVMEYLTNHLRVASRSRDHNYHVDGRKIPI